MPLPVAISVVVLLFQKHLLVPEVCDEGDGGDAEAREGALEPIPARKEACVAPCFTVMC